MGEESDYWKEHVMASAVEWLYTIILIIILIIIIVAAVSSPSSLS